VSRGWCAVAPQDGQERKRVGWVIVLRVGFGKTGTIVQLIVRAPSLATIGISLKAQELYLIVFLTRYLDLFTTFYSLYNFFMKVFYIVATAAIVALLRRSDTSESTYSPTHDSFQHWKYLLLPTILAGSVSYFTPLDLGYVIISSYDDFRVLELLWTISIYLESVAMVPQLIMFRSDRFVKENKGGARDEILFPVFLLGIYRVLYVVNWVYRAHSDFGYQHHYVVYFCGCLQVFFYSQFFHIL
jgi:ER lumen protein retaining receptor